MDTKSKSYSHSLLAKIIAFILLVASFTNIVVLGLNTVNRSQVNLFDEPFEENYYLSDDYLQTMSMAISDLTQLATQYKSEDYIKAGNTIGERLEEQIEYKKQELFDEYNQAHDYEASYEKFIIKFEENHKEEIEAIKVKLIKEDLISFNEIIVRLNRNNGLKYYVKQGEIVFSNTAANSISDFKAYPAYAISEKNDVRFKPEEFEENRNRMSIYGGNIENMIAVDQISVGFTEEYINTKADDWQKSREVIKDVLYKLLILASVLILSLIYLLVTTGRSRLKDEQVEMNKVDRLYTDINIFSIITIIALWAIMIGQISYGVIEGIPLILTHILNAISCGLVLTLLLSLVRHTKNKTLFSHSLVFTAVNKIYLLINNIYSGGTIAIKVALVVVIYPLLVVISLVFFPLTIAAAVWITNKKVKQYNEIKEGVEKIKSGSVDHKIEINKEGEFKNLADGINSIGEGFNSAIANELKSERLKTELITNVSHDIRTPLTSIITYVDLIKRETDKSKIDEYVEIIEQKSMRLKVLTDDLFEASKASSGNIPVNYEKIDIVSLIRQGLGELDSQIRESKLEFRFNNYSDKIHVNADGRLLWRSIENLLSNIFKYALEGSRVYIDIVDLDENIELSIKNISAYELNISSDELMERFKRGDESRATEGSGLGLSISKSLIEAQSGKLDINIDGDLFKVVIVLSKYN